MPNISYESNGKTKCVLPRGFQKLLVRGVRELEVLQMCAKSHCAEAAHDVSSKNHKAVVQTAAQPAISVTSHQSQCHSEENE